MSIQIKNMVAVVGTGGTIAGAADPGAAAHAYRAGQVPVDVLVQAVAAPLLAAHPNRLHGVVTRQVAQIDSRDMDAAVWRALLEAVQDLLADTSVLGVVITHGTDTLEETAIMLSAALVPCKPVVLTAAMRPATDPQPDGPDHLRQAMAWAMTPHAAGVWTVFAGSVWPAWQLRKVDPFARDAFRAVAKAPTARWSEADCQWVGADAAASAATSLEGRAALLEACGWAQAPGIWQERSIDLPWVEVVHSGAAVSGRVIDVLVEAGVDGLVIASTGNGSLHQNLRAALERACAAGRLSRSAIRVATRCTHGGVEGVPEHGWPTLPQLTPAQARVALMMSLLQSPCSMA